MYLLDQNRSREMTDVKITLDLPSLTFKALESFNDVLRAGSVAASNEEKKAVEDLLKHMQLHVDTLVRAMTLKQVRDSKPIESSLQGSVYTDGHFSPASGEYAWGTVTDDLGRDLLTSHVHLLKDMTLAEKETPKGKRLVVLAKFTDVKKNQNNGAELMALVAGMRIAYANPRVMGVFSDSELLVKWWSVGHIKPATAAKMDPIKKQYITELVDLRTRWQKEAYGRTLGYIPGDKNPADLGYHK